MTTPTPVLTALAIYESGKKAYEAYQGIVAFVSLGREDPTPEEEILAKLEVLHQDAAVPALPEEVARRCPGRPEDPLGPVPCRSQRYTAATLGEPGESATEEVALL